MTTVNFSSKASGTFTFEQADPEGGSVSMVVKVEGGRAVEVRFDGPFEGLCEVGWDYAEFA